MGRDDGIGPGEVEFLDTGPGRGSGEGRGRRFALAGLIGLVAAGLVAVGLSGALTGGSSGAATGSPTVTRAQVVPPTGDAVTGARSTSAQVGLDGRPTGVRLTLPAGSSTYNAIPDGAGYLLAVGPTRFLVVECDKHARCHRVVVDRPTGARTLAPHVSPSAAQPGPGGPGVVSPDGTVAAIPVGQSTGQIALFNLATGAAEHFALNPSSGSSPTGWQVLAFSPDSRYLFALAGGELYAVDIPGGRVRDLTAALGSRVLPRLEQLAIRP